MLILGSPGAGKGTQTTRLLRRFSPDLQAFSSGDLLRSNVSKRTSLGIEAESNVAKGLYVQDDVMIRLIVKELNSRGWMSGGGKDCFSSHGLKQGPTCSWILDGFPRTMSQASQLDEYLKEEDALNFVVSLEVPHAVILERISGNLGHEAS
ncbi:GTP:AMP phosphotransferase, mitochondrial [Neolecta irregularis DAH-3]|uniref:GTP:AMP phosphotransferase, mitochondrial n=1 Tax=Neolecta irregularis (strain DAH-3) TaxID=1198029 RepID=A0A1U7LHS7_NEOID|nr:GTP:AMP phosphotransferase, mitochondrial [Neolecta irregularis DAH-3]|eukprot:OLL22199.1 GTP:AMP phosphotransferase, mitochondrial [Neolecta irregularis DAH-3]